MSKEKLFNVYGIRETKNDKYYSLTLVRSDNDKKEWLNVPIKKESVVQNKKGDFFINIKHLAPKKPEKNQEATDENLPF